MTTAKIRKIVTIVEETHKEADQPIQPAVRPLLRQAVQPAFGNLVWIIFLLARLES